MQQAVLPQVPKALKVWRVHDDPNKSREGDVAPNRVMNALHSTFHNLSRCSGKLMCFGYRNRICATATGIRVRRSSVSRSSDAFLACKVHADAGGCTAVLVVCNKLLWAALCRLYITNAIINTSTTEATMTTITVTLRPLLAGAGPGPGLLVSFDGLGA